MIPLHPAFICDQSGTRIAVQVPAREWEALILDRWQAQDMTTGRAAELLGVSVSALLTMAGERGWDVLRISQADLAAELADH